MKSSLMRPALLLALALGLASCGGKAGFTIGGTVSGQQYPGLVLSSNGMDLAVSPPTPPLTTARFSFPKQIEYGDVYDVTVTHQPDHQSCAPTNLTLTKGTAGRLAQIDVPFMCSLNSNSIGGKVVNGLTADGLVLANGSTGGTITLNKGATVFTFPQQVTFGVTYGVTVQAQPAGLTCTVANASGEMRDAPVDNIEVTCK